MPSERVMAIIRDGAFRSSRIIGKGCTSVRFVWWLGGLGNPGNALPRCQLQNLSQLPRNIRTSIEAAKPSRGHQGFLPGVVDWMMSPLEYLPERDATWFWLDTLCIPVNPNKDLNIKQHGHKRSIAYHYHLLQVNFGGGRNREP